MRVSQAAEGASWLTSSRQKSASFIIGNRASSGSSARMSPPWALKSSCVLMVCWSSSSCCDVSHTDMSTLHTSRSTSPNSLTSTDGALAFFGAALGLAAGLAAAFPDLAAAGLAAGAAFSTTFCAFAAGAAALDAARLGGISDDLERGHYNDYRGLVEQSPESPNWAGPLLARTDRQNERSEKEIARTCSRAR